MTPPVLVTEPAVAEVVADAAVEVAQIQADRDVQLAEISAANNLEMTEAQIEARDDEDVAWLRTELDDLRNSLATQGGELSALREMVTAQSEQIIRLSSILETIMEQNPPIQPKPSPEDQPSLSAVDPDAPGVPATAPATVPEPEPEPAKPAPKETDPPRRRRVLI